MAHQITDSDGEKIVVLASGSRIRRQLLQSAGVSFTVAPADLDEDAIRKQFVAKNDTMDAGKLALALAEAKAKSMSPGHPGALVIGCDQTLFFDDRVFAKAKDIDGARNMLTRLRGNTHRLYSAVAFVEDGNTVWSTVTHADLSMREFSDAFIDDYLARQGETTLESLGGYQLEGLGIQLFDRIDGDYFTVLGLPMLPVIAALRAHKVLAT